MGMDNLQKEWVRLEKIFELERIAQIVRGRSQHLKEAEEAFLKF